MSERTIYIPAGAGLTTCAAAIIILCVLALPARAIWHSVLNEHFQLDPPTWPWGNWTIQPPPGVPYSWGVSGYTYKYNGFDTQSIWCVGSPGTLNPEFDDYPPNVNSWAKWGPINLSQAVAARASFWYFCLTELNDDYARWGGWDSNQFNMYEGGRVSGTPLQQWWNASVNFDSLAGGTQSLLGDASVWLEFHFHSDSDGLTNTGVFIDEVSIAWDDGTFDLKAEMAWVADLDSNQIGTVITGDTVIFVFRWIAEGTGTTPMFDITCDLDGAPFYDERRDAEIGTSQQIWVNSYSRPWIAQADTHTVFWVLDASNEITEYSETNNDTSKTFVVQEPNAPPWIQVIRPTWGDTANTEFLITWEDEDPDDNAYITLYWDNDSTGYNGILIPGAVAIPEDDETDSFLWNTTTMVEMPVWVLAYIEDGNTFVYDYSDGPLIIDHSAGLRDWPISPDMPSEFTLESIYPNPFNSSTTIRVGLPVGETVEVKVFDSMGRLSAIPFKGLLTAGYHDVTWSPNDLPSGIYLVELKAPEIRVRSKAVFLK